MSLTNSPIWFGSGATGGGFYGYEINDSLRFNDDDSAVLTRTPPSNGNRKTWTYSFWVKRANLTSYEGFLAVGTGDGSEDFFGFTTTHKLYFRYSSGSDFTSSQVFRDVSSWYHIVLVADTTQSQSSSTASDSRLRYYVNGTQITAFDSGTMPSQNFDFRINSAAQHYIGEFPRISSHLDGYMAEVNFIGGQALDPTSFGETKDGVWVPKAYGGSYGTNGFYLDFSDNSTATNLGLDSSGNSNNWSVNGIATTDQMIDTPTNNFSTLNVLSKDDTSVVYSEGNLQAINSTSTSRRAYSTIAVKSGKWYFEYYVNAIGSSTTNAFGVQQATDVWADGLRAYRANGDYFNGSSWISYGATFTTGDIISFAVDYDSDTIEFFKNNVSQGEKTSVGFDTSYDYVALINLVSSFKATANFGQDSSFAGATTAGGNADANGVGDFKYSVPSGYLALCTANLPEPVVGPLGNSLSDENFNTVLYTGNGTSQSITGVGFQPDFVWLKGRDFLSNHRLNDSVRGASRSLKSNDTSTEDTTSTYYTTSFDSDGFSLVSGPGDVNQDTEPFVSWNWKAGGTASSNTDGDITSSVSANTDAGFSVVGYTGDGVSGTRTIGCGLEKKPDLVILKNRTEDSVNDTWFVYGTPLGSSSPSPYLTLYNGDPVAASGVFVDTSFSDNSGNALFAVSGSYNGVNKSGTTYIAYCFHNVEGYSKTGSYIGNYNVDGPFVYTGFKPAFIIIKSTVSSGYSWYMMDSTRTAYNGSQAWLSPNETSTEDTSTGENVDILSNGFKIRTNWTRLNDSGSPKYLYFAFAENPFKYANAR